MTRRHLLRSLLLLCLTGSTSARSRRPSLMQLKLKLAREPRPYLHLTPEGIFIYFKTILLKNLSVLRIEPEPQGALTVSRVEAWHPPFSRPTIHSESAPDEALNVLEVEDMPESFVILFHNDEVWAINPGKTNSPVSRYEEIFESLKRIDESAHRMNPERVTIIFLEETEARELYWILQEDLAAIN